MDCGRAGVCGTRRQLLPGRSPPQTGVERRGLSRPAHGQGGKARPDHRRRHQRQRRALRPRLLRAQRRGDPGKPEPWPGEDGGLRLVRHPRAPAPVALETHLRLRGQLGSRNPPGDTRDPHPPVPVDAQELRVDEEDAEARSQDERDPGQVQEIQERRGAAAEDERGADEALPGGRLQPDERQLPILVAFYNVLSRAIELRHAPFVLWITDLSAMDRTYVLLILMTVTMYVQQAMTPTTVDPAQKKIFMAMPLLWGFFLKDMPSGLVLYWLFSNVLTILQQVLIQKMGKDEPNIEKPAKLKRVRA